MILTLSADKRASGGRPEWQEWATVKGRVVSAE